MKTSVFGTTNYTAQRKYLICIREETCHRYFKANGIVAAAEAYNSACQLMSWTDTVGTVELIDGETGELLETTDYQAE